MEINKVEIAVYMDTREIMEEIVTLFPGEDKIKLDNNIKSEATVSTKPN
jgi:hypothetical protein